ncbi:MAG: RHS repeat-associated core domain-containing protein [Terracidiphilus sp.]
MENRVIQAENALSCASASPCTYLYDPLGERKEKSVGGTATDFVLAGGEEIADYYEASATWRLTVRGAGGLPLAAVVPGASEQIVYVHHDIQGSTVALTTAGSSGPADTYTYSDYGAPQSGSWSAYQYAGYRYDSETGLYYVRARYYSPVLGRFMQSDPAGFGGGFNLYAYVGNDPVNLIDPGGQAPGDVYAVTPSGASGVINSAGQIAMRSWGTQYQHVAIEINPIKGVPYVAQENPIPGANILPLSDFLAQNSASEIDQYTPKVAFTSSQLSNMTQLATNMQGTPWNYAVFWPWTEPLSMQCAEYVNYLTSVEGAAAPLSIPLSGALLGRESVLPSDMSNSSTYSLEI